MYPRLALNLLYDRDLSRTPDLPVSASQLLELQAYTNTHS